MKYDYVLCLILVLITFIVRIQVDPQKRYTAEECLQHPWLQPGSGSASKLKTSQRQESLHTAHMPTSAGSNSKDSGKKRDSSDDDDDDYNGDDDAEDKKSDSSDYDRDNSYDDDYQRGGENKWSRK